MAANQAVDLSAVYVRIDQIMRGVPGVTDERKQAWIDAVLRVDPKRIMWHVERLAGIGGSEIGTVVMERSGRKASIFTTARKIVSSKLMLRAPERSSVAMMVGTALESQLREAFHAEMEKYDCVTDQKAYDAIRELTSPENNAKREHPWLIGNPDDIVLLRNRRFVVDYKITLEQESSEQAAEDAATLEVFADYPYQLNHYTSIVREAKHPVDGMLLVKWVKDEEGYFALRMATVPFDVERQRSIIDAGSWAWQQRCMGVLPEYPTIERVDLLQQHPEIGEVGLLSEKYYAYKSLADKFTAMADEYKEMIRDVVAEYAPVDESIKVGNLLSISTKPVFDLAAVKDEFGEDVIESAKVTGDYDTEKLAEKVGELSGRLGENVNEHLESCKGLTFSPSRLGQLLFEQGADPAAYQKTSVTVRQSPPKDLSAVVGEHVVSIVDGGFKDVFSVVSGREKIPFTELEARAAVEKQRLAEAKAAEKAVKAAEKAAEKAAKAAEKPPKKASPSIG